jgi:hypothetical protein
MILVLIERLKRVRMLVREWRAQWICGVVGRVCVRPGRDGMSSMDQANDL